MADDPGHQPRPRVVRHYSITPDSSLALSVWVREYELHRAVTFQDGDFFRYDPDTKSREFVQERRIWTSRHPADMDDYLLLQELELNSSMERDLDFTRQLLLALEKWTPDDDLEKILLAQGLEVRESEETDCNLRYHLHILKGAGYVEGIEVGLEMGDRCPFPELIDPYLTWPGHEFLESIRPQKVYEQVQAKVKVLGSVSFEVVKALGVDFLKKQAGLS